MSTQAIQPGSYDYQLRVRFDSYYIPDHTPPAFRDTAGYQAKRTRTVWGTADIAQQADYETVRQFFVKKVCEELLIDDVEVLQFELTSTA